MLLPGTPPKGEANIIEYPLTNFDSEETLTIFQCQLLRAYNTIITMDNINNFQSTLYKAATKTGPETKNHDKQERELLIRNTPLIVATNLIIQGNKKNHLNLAASDRETRDGPGLGGHFVTLAAIIFIFFGSI